MAITYTSFAAAESNTVSMPTHSANDLIFAHAWRNSSTTPPTLPSGWINLREVGNSNGSVRLAYKIASSNAESTGTWTNANAVAVAVYSPGVNEFLIPQAVNGSIATSGTTISHLVYSSSTLVRTNSTAWIVSFTIIENTDSDMTIAPSGISRRDGFTGSAFQIALYDSNATLTNINASENVGGTSANWITSGTAITLHSFIPSGGVPLIGPGGLVY